jgi:uncharacterized membrane protein YgcG
MANPANLQKYMERTPTCEDHVVHTSRSPHVRALPLLCKRRATSIACMHRTRPTDPKVAPIIQKMMAKFGGGGGGGGMGGMGGGFGGMGGGDFGGGFGGATPADTDFGGDAEEVD